MAAYRWVDGLKATYGLTACAPRSALGPTFSNEYGRTLPFYLRVLQGKVTTLNRWGGKLNHLSMVYSLSNIYTVPKIIGIGQLLLKLLLVHGW